MVLPDRPESLSGYGPRGTPHYPGFPRGGTLPPGFRYFKSDGPVSQTVINTVEKRSLTRFLKVGSTVGDSIKIAKQKRCTIEKKNCENH